MNILAGDLKKQEKIGELFIYSQLLLVGLFPVIAHYVTRQMPSLLFAGMNALVASGALLIFLFITGQYKYIFNKKALLYILGVTLFVVIIPDSLIYTGASQTSSSSMAILLLTEVFFTFIIAGLFLKERITIQKMIGGIVIVAGACAVLYNGKFIFNIGDILIIFATAFYPIGNYFAKKAFECTAPAVVLFVRYIIGGVFLILLSFFVNTYSMPLSVYVVRNYFFILISGVFIFFLAKLLFYEGLKRMDISKAIPIGMAYPAFSLVYAYFFLHEVPTLFQIGGFVVVFVGILLLVRKNTPTIQTKSVTGDTF